MRRDGNVDSRLSRESRMASSLTGKASQGPARSSMLAWRVHKFGPPEAMILESVPRPDPGPGEVLVDVHAAGVGPWDGWIRAGKSALPQPLPQGTGCWSHRKPDLQLPFRKCRLPRPRPFRTD